MLTRPSSNGGQPLPTPKSSVDYVLASSTSSYAHSIVPSSFTLSLNTTDNSRPQSLLLSCAKIPCVYHLSQHIAFSSLYNQLLIEWLIPSLLYNVFLFCSQDLNSPVSIWFLNMAKSHGLAIAKLNLTTAKLALNGLVQLFSQYDCQANEAKLKLHCARPWQH